MKNHEDYVSFEQAKMLKELGFDWGCQAYFEDYVDELNRHHRKFRFNAVANDMLYKDFCSAPTLAQAQKWLREKGIFLYIKPLVSKSFYVFEYVIDRMETIDRIESKPQFDTYEQALSSGIDRALELFKTTPHD